MAVLLDTSLPPPVDPRPCRLTLPWIFASSCSPVRPVPPGMMKKLERQDAEQRRHDQQQPG